MENAELMFVNEEKYKRREKKKKNICRMTGICVRNSSKNKNCMIR
jgi:hypothetical protein